MPKRSAVDNWSSGDVKRYLTSVSLHGAAEKLQEEDVDGRAAVTLTSSDLKEAGIYVISERKKTETALENLRHPLMTVFASVDSNNDFKVDAEEISHVLSNLSGTYVAEATVLTKMAEMKVDEYADFAQFMGIVEQASESEEVDWSRASKQISLPARFLAAGDGVLSDFHAAMRAGTKAVNDFPEQYPPRYTPGIIYRALAYWIGCICCVVLDCLTFGLFSWFGLLYLSPRGQYCYQWLFGLQCVDYKTGKPANRFQLYCSLVSDAVVGCSVLHIFGSAFRAPLQDEGVTTSSITYSAEHLADFKWLYIAVFTYTLLNFASALSDPEGRLLMDRAVGTVIVFKESKPRKLFASTIPQKERHPPPQAQ